MTGIYRLAGLNIEITTIQTYAHRLCEAYKTDGPADFSIAVDENDARFEALRTAREDAFCAVPERTFSEAHLEALAVYRKISERLPDYDAFLMHGSCLAMDGVSYLFTAKSGTGKSTHARLWREVYGDRVVMVNDDKPMIRFLDGRPYAFGTPWNGKHRLSTNIAVPLQAVCILDRGNENVIVPMRQREAYAKLVQQIYRPLDAAAMAKTLTLIDRLCATTKLFRLECNMDPEAARVSYAAMSGDGKES